MEKIYDVVIIGSGPAGLSAAVYAKRAQLETLVIEKDPMSGGQILNTYEVDNYLGLPGINGFDLGMKMKEHADKFDTEFVSGEVEKVDTSDSIKKVIMNNGTTYQTKTVIISTGASNSKLGLEGEKNLSGKGVSYCATCDGAFFRDKTVAVVGGGDTAVEDAIFLARGSKQVYLIHRRDKLRAAKILQEKLLSLPNVTVLWSSVLEEITGEDKVDGITVKYVNSNTTTHIDLDGVFIAVGTKPNTKLVDGIVDLSDDKYIVADEDCITSQEGIFAVGDVRTKPLRQIITAASDGALAVYSIEKYLSEKY